MTVARVSITDAPDPDDVDRDGGVGRDDRGAECREVVGDANGVEDPVYVAQLRVHAIREDHDQHEDNRKSPTRHANLHGIIPHAVIIAC